MIDNYITPESMAGLQDAINGVETVWNAMLDAAGKVRERAIKIGFSPEAADQVGLMVFNQVLKMSSKEEE